MRKPLYLFLLKVEKAGLIKSTKAQKVKNFAEKSEFQEMQPKKKQEINYSKYLIILLTFSTNLCYLHPQIRAGPIVHVIIR